MNRLCLLQLTSASHQSSVMHRARIQHVHRRHTVLNTCSSFPATAATYRQTPTDWQVRVVVSWSRVRRLLFTSAVVASVEWNCWSAENARLGNDRPSTRAGKCFRFLSCLIYSEFSTLSDTSVHVLLPSFVLLGHSYPLFWYRSPNFCNLLSFVGFTTIYPSWCHVVIDHISKHVLSNNVYHSILHLVFLLFIYLLPTLPH